MARRKEKYLGLPDSTRVEVVATKGDKVIKREMTLGEAREIKKKGGWYYRNFQLGFSQFNKEN